MFTIIINDRCNGGEKLKFHKFKIFFSRKNVSSKQGVYLLIKNLRHYLIRLFAKKKKKKTGASFLILSRLRAFNAGT